MLSVMLLSMLMILLSTLDMIRHLICGNNLNWLLNLILIYETLGWGSKWLVNFNARKTHLVSFDRLTTLLLLMWKWTGLFLKKNHPLRCWGWLLDRGSYMISIAKTVSKKLELWFVLWGFFLLGLLCISMNLPYRHAWNTVVMSEQVLLVATWNCWISYKNGYAGLSVLHLLPLLNPWLIVKM